MTDPRLAAQHAKYPKAYPLPDRDRSPWAFDRYGFQCGPGWAGILDKLGAVLEQHGTHVHQVKEKLGWLRVYTGKAPSEVNTAIDEAEAASRHTCELCGAFGWRSSIFGWLKTYCQVCRESELTRVAVARGLHCPHVPVARVLVSASLEPFAPPDGLGHKMQVHKMALVCEACAPSMLQAAAKCVGLEWP